MSLGLLPGCHRWLSAVDGGWGHLEGTLLPCSVELLTSQDDPHRCCAAWRLTPSLEPISAQE
jgi:hypothetical protein